MSMEEYYSWVKSLEQPAPVKKRTKKPLPDYGADAGLEKCNDPNCCSQD